MGKIAFRPWPKDEKQEKLCFGRGRRTENAKNRPSSADETKNTAKTARRRPTKARITHFLRFQPLGKPESLIFYASNPLESQNHSFSALPTPWKVRITQFLRFQPLGKPKSPNFCASNPLESQNHSFFAFPTPWKVRKRGKTAFHPRMTGKKRQFLPCIHG